MNRSLFFVLFATMTMAMACTQATTAAQQPSQPTSSGRKPSSPDARMRVYSPDGSAFVECPGTCPDDVIAEMAQYTPPTQARLDKVRADHIAMLANPPPLDPATCGSLPTIPWESWKIEEGGPSANLPGYTFRGDMPAMWSRAAKVNRTRLKETDQPIGKVQDGDAVWIIYRLKTGDLVSCNIMQGRDIPVGTCDLQYRTPEEYCTYSQTIIRGH